MRLVLGSKAGAVAITRSELPHPPRWRARGRIGHKYTGLLPFKSCYVPHGKGAPPARFLSLPAGQAKKENARYDDGWKQSILQNQIKNLPKRHSSLVHAVNGEVHCCQKDEKRQQITPLRKFNLVHRVVRSTMRPTYRAPVEGSWFPHLRTATDVGLGLSVIVLFALPRLVCFRSIARRISNELAIYLAVETLGQLIGFCHPLLPIGSRL